MENILILGAGLMQKPAIIAGKKLGFHTVVADGNPAAVCIAFADEFKPIDLKDKENLASLGRELQKRGGLAAVFTAGTDFSASVAYVAEKCGLSGHSYESALNASIKTRMRACFRKAGVPSPVFREVTEVAENEVENVMEYPLVVKPVDNMGARGCRMIRSSREFLPAAKAAVENSKTHCAILEDYMCGPEYSIDAIIYDGTMTVTGFADRHIYFPPYFIETGHTMPTACDSLMYRQLISTFALGVKSLGLTRGAVKADIKYTEKGPMIGEIAARLSGGYMSGWTYPYASDCNLTEQAMLVACGRKPEYLENYRKELPFIPPETCQGVPAPFRLFDLPCIRTSAERAWISIPGIIREITGLENAVNVPYVMDVLPRSTKGSTVVFPRNNVEKCGNIISAASSRLEAVEAAEKAVRCITIRLEGKNPETDRFLAGLCGVAEAGFPPSAYVLDDRTRQQFELFCRTAQDIPSDAATLPLIPACLRNAAESGIKDWNYSTIPQTLERFDRLCPLHGKISGAYFWRSLLRGGIQGVLYAADSR